MRVALLAALASVGASMPLSAEPTQLRLETSAAYRHKPSGLELAPVLAGIPRKTVTILNPDVDEAIDFATPDSREEVTVYVFRHVSGSVPVWFDRIRWQVEHRDSYGGATPIDRPARVTPPNQSAATGLMMAFTPRRGPYRATGAVLLPLGPDWFVAIRYSSATLGPEQLFERMAVVTNAIGWPKRIAAQPAAELIETCKDPIKFERQAKALPADMGSVIMASALSGGVKGLPPQTSVTWCRDPQRVDGNQAVYRADNSPDGYLLAFGDADVGATVNRDQLGPLLVKSDRKQWSVSMLLLDRTLIFPGLDRLPEPADLAAAVNRAPAATATTYPKSGKISINSDIVK